MAALIKADGTRTEIQPKNGKNFTLQELYDHIGCSMVQLCEGAHDGKILIFDEEFLCRGDLVRHPSHGIALETRDDEGRTVYKPYLNRVATMLMHPSMGPMTHNVICGNAVHCDDSEFE